MSVSSVFVIAEAGVNHNGSLHRALEMVSTAVRIGADGVKFQAWKADNLASRHAGKAEYQKETTESGESQLDMLRPLQLSTDDHLRLQACCKQKGIKYLCSPFDVEGIEMLINMQADPIKVPSGELTNLPYLRRLGASGRNIILSTGMATMEEVGSALEVLMASGMTKDAISILHCTTEYPTPFSDVNLQAMLSIAKEFDVRVGYSDHTAGIEVSIAAVALGASIIEKHFTLDRNLPGPDHKASLEPEEFAQMVIAIRNIENAMGTGTKTPSPSETKNIAIARKSIVASRNIRQGERFTTENVCVKRPGSGISPMRWDEVLKTHALRDFQADELITLD